ncbi:hypothetical protein ACFQZS_06655 [Mucilaginibacter calamicampi]|uniref:Lipoprotein n=1 Tax=Mucilaginibacter calamicampi TaxID=1302352 RepID=A0ABW2YVC5_9SPHI
MKFCSYLIFVTVLIFIISCNAKDKKSGRYRSKGFATNAIATSAETPQGVALKFYKWYIKEMYPDSSIDKPQLLINADSIYRLDTTYQFARLRKTDFFSEDFFKIQTRNYQSCDLWLKNTRIKEIESYQSAPNNICDFFSNYSWVGGQGENVTDARIASHSIKDNKAIIKMEILIDGVSYSHPKVVEYKENGLWKIARIDLEW